MEYVYVALLLHKLGKEINEENIKKVLQSVGAEADESKVKSLIASLKNVDIAKELETATVAVAPAAGQAAEKPAEKKEEKKEEAAEGLSALFG